MPLASRQCVVHSETVVIHPLNDVNREAENNKHDINIKAMAITRLVLKRAPCSYNNPGISSI